MLNTHIYIKTTPDWQLLSNTISILHLKSIWCYVPDYACFNQLPAGAGKSMKQVLSTVSSLLEIFAQGAVQIIPVPAARQLTNRVHGKCRYANIYRFDPRFGRCQWADSAATGHV